MRGRASGSGTASPPGGREFRSIPPRKPPTRRAAFRVQCWSTWTSNGNRESNSRRINSNMKMFRAAIRFLLLVWFATQAVPVPAQPNLSGAAELEESLRKLNELGSVLMIAAHPDDERTGVLAYFARGRHM